MDEMKSKIKKLAKNVKFVSVMFADEFGFSNREPLRYYLWKCELIKWIKENHKIQVYTREFLGYEEPMYCPVVKKLYGDFILNHLTPNRYKLNKTEDDAVDVALINALEYIDNLTPSN